MISEEQLYQKIWKNKNHNKNNIYVEKGSRMDIASKIIEGGEKLLDIGCGDGTFGALVNEKYKEIYGIDISSSALKIAEKRGIKTIKVNLNEENIPVPNKYFDTVICLDVIEHIFDTIHLLKEINRILVDDGILVISTPNIRYYKHIFTLLFFGRFPRTSGDLEGYDGGHIHYFTYKDICNLLKNMKFEILEKHGVFGRNFFKELLSTGIIIKAKKVK